MTKRILITGGAGLLGSHTIEYFLKTTDYDLIVIDSFSRLGDLSIYENFEGYSPERVKLFWHDLNATFHSQMTEEMGEIDIILNMASGTNPVESLANPHEFVTNNINLILNVLELARALKPSLFLQVSTGSIYGPSAPNQPHTENSLMLPSNPYAASKAAQEMIAFSYWRTFNVPVVITNTLNNFGERQAGNMMLPLTVKKVLAGETNKIHAKKVDGNWISGSRVWLHAVNHADACKFIIEHVKPKLFTDGADEPERFNIAGDIEIKNDEIVQKVGEILEIEPIVEYVDFHSERSGHDLHYNISDEKLRNLGWSMPVSTDDSFERVVRWAASQEQT